jgi:diguanylate cyclase (GGDEF)-like protein
MRGDRSMKAKRVSHWCCAFAQPTTYLGIIAIVIILSGAFFLEKEEYDRAYEHGIQRGANLTRVVEEHVSRIFYATDSQLLLLRQFYQRNPEDFDLARWNNNFRLDNDLAIQFTIAGPGGKILLSDPGSLPPATYVGDQNYFLVHVNSSKDDFFVSVPMIDSTSKKKIILLSRRLTKSDGSFGGVVFASLDPGLLQRFFDSIDVGQDGIISFVGFDGIIRAYGRNYSYRKSADYVGRSVSKSIMLKLHRQTSSGYFWSDSNLTHKLDSIPRLISYRAIQRLHLFAIVGFADAEVFRHAREYARTGWSKAFFFAGIILVAISIAATRERKLIAAKLALSHQAHHDALTGLANRQAFVHEIENALSRCRTNNEVFSIFMLDLDRFKDVNDSLGHPAGDALLKETAKRLKSSLRNTDFLARLGGDEFAIIQSGKTKSQNKNTKQREQYEVAIDLANRIVGCLKAPFYIDGKQINVGTSVGIAPTQDDNADSNEIMKRADLALYSAKAQGPGSYVFFDRKMVVQTRARQRLECELRNGISNHELELHYQPIINVKTRKICSIEALVRWRHPQRGLIGPHEFIPIAEATDLIVPLGQWVLQRACMDAVTWPPNVKVVVNLSTTQFKKSNLIADVNQALLKSGLSARRLEVDITESVLFDDDGRNLQTLYQLKRLGVTIALDDFGTGYLSLKTLTEFPFDKIKIDTSFILNMTKTPACAAVIATVITLGRCLDILTTAEGVESKQEFESLRASGINFVQGHLLGSPRPASELKFDDFYWRGLVGNDDRVTNAN